MGTSTALPGPNGGPWTSAKKQLTKWKPTTTSEATSDGEISPAQEEWAERTAEGYRTALADSLRNDPEFSNLRPTAVLAGGRLVQALGELLDGRSPLVDPSGASAKAREDRFVARFVGEVAGNGGLISDAVARRTARRTAEQLLDDGSPVGAALRAGGGDVRITGELFCTVYRLFFGEYVGEFIRTTLAEGMALAAPIALPIDPTGLIVGAVTRQIVKALPDPCGATTDREPRQGLLAKVAGELLTDVVDQALGIREEEVPCPPASTSTNTSPTAG
jgi:hypothetical protein